MTWRKGILMASLLLLRSMSVPAAEAPGFPTRPALAQREAVVHGHEDAFGLTGGWGGVRERLLRRGLRLEASWSGEFVRNFDPGLANGRKDTIYHDNVDLTATLDTEKAGLWPGGTLFVYGLFNHGGSPSASVIGDIQVVSNIEAGRNQLIVQEAWYEQRWMSGRLSLLAGLHDLNADFYVSDYASLFLNSSFGIGPELSGNVPASLFPRAGWGVRGRIDVMDSVYVQAAAFDGDPATRSLSSREGAMLIAEAGYLKDGSGYKAGVWRHTRARSFGSGGGGNYGVYGIVDRALWSPADDASVGVFLQWGWAPAARNAITRYLGVGAHLHGMIPGRDEDDIGLAVAQAFTHDATERTLELTWRIAIRPWLAMQPSLQWVMHPGGQAGAATIRVGLLRFEAQL